MDKYNLTIGTDKRNRYMPYKEENDEKNKIIEIFGIKPHVMVINK